MCFVLGFLFESCCFGWSRCRHGFRGNDNAHEMHNVLAIDLEFGESLETKALKSTQSSLTSESAMLDLFGEISFISVENSIWSAQGFVPESGCALICNEGQ